MSPNRSLLVKVAVVNHFPRITELNAVTALAFDEWSSESVCWAYFGCAALVIAEPADTVGPACGVLYGEGSGNRPSVNTCEIDVTTYASCRPDDDNTIYADGMTDFSWDKDTADTES